MAKSPAERKAAQRQRQQEAGVTKIELLLDNQELCPETAGTRSLRCGKCGDGLFPWPNVVFLVTQRAGTH